MLYALRLFVACVIIIVTHGEPERATLEHEETSSQYSRPVLFAVFMCIAYCKHTLLQIMGDFIA